MVWKQNGAWKCEIGDGGGKESTVHEISGGQGRAFKLLDSQLDSLSTSCSSLILHRDTEPLHFLSRDPKIKHLVLLPTAEPDKSFARAIGSV